MDLEVLSRFAWDDTHFLLLLNCLTTKGRVSPLDQVAQFFFDFFLVVQLALPPPPRGARGAGGP